jgi:hypothetical protein
MPFNPEAFSAEARAETDRARELARASESGRRLAEEISERNRRDAELRAATLRAFRTDNPFSSAPPPPSRPPRLRLVEKN